MPHPSTQPVKVCTSSLNWLACVYHQKPYINTALCHLGPNQRCSVAKSDAYPILCVYTHMWQYWPKLILCNRWLCVTSRPAFFSGRCDCLCISTTMIACSKNFYKRKGQLYKETLCPPTHHMDKASCYLSMTPCIAWDSHPPLSVTPAHLMRTGVGRNAPWSCKAQPCKTSRDDGSYRHLRHNSYGIQMVSSR